MNDEVKFHEFVTVILSFLLFVSLLPQTAELALNVLKSVDRHEGVAQVFVGLATIFFAYWVPAKFREFDNIEKKKQDIFKFNEALVSHGVLIEGLISNIDRVKEAYKAETAILYNIKAFNHPAPKGEIIKYTYILPLMLPDVSNIISKISNLGTDVHKIVMAYSRIVPHIRQYDFISEERGNLAKLLIVKSEDSVVTDTKWFERKNTELLEMTLNLIRSAEVILDHSLYISPLMNALSEIERSNLKNMTSESVSILSLEYMDVHEEYRLLLRSIVDEIDGKGKRHLYLDEVMHK